MSNAKFILMDMDGVVTSEEGYWRATACTLVDFSAFLGHRQSTSASLSSSSHALPWTLSIDLSANALAQNLSLNTNWDHCHAMCVALLIVLCEHNPSNLARLLSINWESDEFGEAMDWPENLEPTLSSLTSKVATFADSARGFDLLDRLAQMLPAAAGLLLRKGPVWQWLYRHFQCWFVGTQSVQKERMKCSIFPLREGIIAGESLIQDPLVIAHTLATLKSAGWSLGIATGRPRAEILPTLSRFDLLASFTSEAIVTHDEIAKGEDELKASGVSAHLSKPHPFPFLRALFPSVGACHLVGPEFPKLDFTVVIVGDTIGDISAASAIGATPVGVLTGPSGENARDSLVSAGAQGILRNITELPPFLRKFQRRS